MRTYLISELPGGLVAYDKDRAFRGTLAAAHELAKEARKRGQDVGAAVRIEELDVATNKEAILRMLNDEGGYAGPVLRTWRLGHRGGLVECPNGD